MLEINKHKMYTSMKTLWYGEPRTIEVLLSIGKMIWGIQLLTLSYTTIQYEFFYQLQRYGINDELGWLFIIDAVAKLIAALFGNANLRKYTSLVGVILWGFLLFLTFSSSSNFIAMMKLTVLLICDSWLFIRLGAVNDYANHHRQISWY